MTTDERLQAAEELIARLDERLRTIEEESASTTDQARQALEDAEDALRAIDALAASGGDIEVEVASGHRARFSLGLLKKMSFGIVKRGGGKITIAAGCLIDSAVQADAAETELTLTTGVHYIGWKYVYATHAMTIVDFGSTFTLDPAEERKWLYRVSAVAGGTVRVLEYGWLNPLLPANFGRSA